MSNNKPVPHFIRQPASLIVLQQRLDVQTQFSNALLELIATEFPAIKDKAGKLFEGLNQAQQGLGSLNGELILKGHGPRGALVSQTLTTKKENEAFLAKTVQPAENPIDPQVLISTLESYLAVDGGEKGRQFAMPDEVMYGQQLRDGAKIADADLMEQPDGIYLVANDKGSSYTLKVTVDGGALVFSPLTGPTLVTWSEIERGWVQHTAWAYGDGEKTLQALAAFFEKTNVRDATVGELKTLESTLRKMPKAKLDALAQTTGEQQIDINLPINELFKIRFTVENDPVIISARDDVQWENLTIYTRRRLFRDTVARVKEANAASAPKAEAKTETKPVKKAAAKKAAR
ncbi:hypothetical protein [Xanthomonas phage RTH11]|nr:hypothetical protein [Xanthomonas phage RTH11]